MIELPQKLGMKFRLRKSGNKIEHIGWTSHRRRLWEGKIPTRILKGSIGKDFDLVMNKVKPLFKKSSTFKWFYHMHTGAETRFRHRWRSIWDIYKGENGLICKNEVRKYTRYHLTTEQKRTHKRKLKAERRHVRKVNDLLQSLMNNLPVLKYYSVHVRELKNLDYRVRNFTVDVQQVERKKRLSKIRRIIQNIENEDYSDVYKDLIYMSKYYKKPCHHF